MNAMKTPENLVPHTYESGTCVLGYLESNENIYLRWIYDHGNNWC